MYKVCGFLLELIRRRRSLANVLVYFLKGYDRTFNCSVRLLRGEVVACHFVVTSLARYE